MSDLPLAGRRVVITRAAEQAGELAALLEAQGAEPIVVALIDIVEPSDGGAALSAALARLGDYDWLVVTSSNGAKRVAAAVAAADNKASRTRLAAVGTATAAMLGGDVDLVPSRQLGSQLVEEFPSGRGRVLVAQSEIAGPEVASGIAAKGWTVDAVPAYRTVPVRPSAAMLLSVLSADAVLFASGSSVRSWVASFGTESPPVAVAIGPATAEVAADLGLKIDAIAADHSVSGFVSTLLMVLGRTD